MRMRCKGWNVRENVGGRSSERKKGKRVFKYAGISFVDAPKREYKQNRGTAGNDLNEEGAHWQTMTLSRWK